MRVGLSKTAIFGDLSGYFLNFTDKAGGRQYYDDDGSPCWPVTDCKMNDLEWLFHVKIRFSPALLDSERLTFKNNCVKINRHRSSSYLANIAATYRPIAISGRNVGQ